jgi:outer membrane protein assembly factor BamB
VVQVGIASDRGEEIWAVPFEMLPACPWSPGLILENSGHAVQFDDETGRLIEIETGKVATEKRLEPGWFATSPPTAMADKILVGAGNRVSCFHKRGLDALWSVNFSRDRVVLSPPIALDPGFIAQAVNDSGTLIVKLHPEEGSVEWTVSIPGVARGVASVVGDRLFVVTLHGGRRELVALSTRDGEPLWTARLTDSLPDFGLSETEVRVAVRGDTLYAPSQHGITAFSVQSGGILWETRGIPPDGSSPSIGGEIGYVTSRLGDLFALDLQSGDVLWSFGIGGAVHSPPVLGERAITVLTDHGELVQITDATGEAS